MPSTAYCETQHAVSLSSDSAKTRTFRIMAAGDVIIHDKVREAATLPDETFDFAPFFAPLIPLLQKGDLVMANLETPVAGDRFGYTGFPDFNAPDALITALKKTGFNFLVTANNHALDRNWSGLLQTLATIDAAGLRYAGAYQSKKDKESRLLFTMKDVTIGCLAYTYGVNGNHRPKATETWRLSLINEAVMKKEVAQLKKQGAECIIVHLHFGEEYQREADIRQKRLAKMLFAEGVDIIIGHHPHVAQPYQRILTAQSDQAIIYSLGNLLSNQQSPYTHLGTIFECEFSIDVAKKKSLAIRLHPVVRHIQTKDGEADTYRIFLLEDALVNAQKYALNPATTAVFAAEFMDMHRLLYNIPLPKPQPTQPVAAQNATGKE